KRLASWFVSWRLKAPGGRVTMTRAPRVPSTIGLKTRQIDGQGIDLILSNARRPDREDRFDPRQRSSGMKGPVFLPASRAGERIVPRGALLCALPVCASGAVADAGAGASIAVVAMEDGVAAGSGSCGITLGATGVGADRSFA